MSESAPEPSSGGSSPFMRKMGPLPVWAWMGVGLAAVLAFSYYKKSKTAATTTGTGTSSGSASVNSPGGVDASLVPQFVNQVYESSTPPPAPSVTVNNTIPTPVATTPTPAPTPAPAKTISGSPGSFTTGLANGMNEWTSTGKYSLNAIAKSHGMTAQQLIASSESSENNAALQAYVKGGNLNAPVPSGVQLFIPNANWATR
jgi:hypothetical protein